jgi:hypothetical protein
MKNRHVEEVPQERGELPSNYTRADGVTVDISELIRGGVRLGQSECQIDAARSEMPMSIEDMWSELEKALMPKKESKMGEKTF